MQQCRGGYHGTKPDGTPIIPLLAPEAFGTNKNGGMRTVCRRCDARRAREKRDALRIEGKRRCRNCREVKPVKAFGASRRKGVGVRLICLACEKQPPMDPIREAEEDLAAGLRARQRFAISLAILLGSRRMSVADYKALRGDARRAFEARWSALMREMAEDAGEWREEWSTPPGGHVVLPRLSFPAPAMAAA